MSYFRAKIILANVPVEPNYKHGVTFFVGKFSIIIPIPHSKLTTNIFSTECRKFISEALTLLKLLRGQIQNVRHAQLYRLKLSNITRCSKHL